MKRREFIKGAVVAGAIPPAFIPGKESKGGHNPPNTSTARPLPPKGSESKSIATDLPIILIEDGEITNLQEFLDHGRANDPCAIGILCQTCKIIAFLPEETPKCVVLPDGHLKDKIHMYWGEVTLIIHKEEYRSREKTNTYTFAEIRPTEKSMRKILHANMFYDFRESKNKNG